MTLGGPFRLNAVDWLKSDREERMDHVSGAGEAVIFFDTNVLIAASVSPIIPIMSAVTRGLTLIAQSGGACAAHTLAEAYSTLTNVAKGYGVPTLASPFRLSRMFRQNLHIGHFDSK